MADDKGWTAIRYAAKANNSDSMDLLIDWGADLCAKTANSETLLRWLSKTAMVIHLPLSTIASTGI